MLKRTTQVLMCLTPVHGPVAYDSARNGEVVLLVAVVVMVVVAVVTATLAEGVWERRQAAFKQNERTAVAAKVGVTGGGLALSLAAALVAEAAAAAKRGADADRGKGSGSSGGGGGCHGSSNPRQEGIFV